MTLTTPIGGKTILPDAGRVESQPNLSFFPNGGHVLTWEEDDETILAQLFDARGAPLGAAFDVSPFEGDRNRPDVAVLADGSFVVTYTAIVPGLDSSISARRFDADGTPLGPEFVVFRGFDQTSFAPSIAALSDGGFVIAYNGLWRDGSNYSYHARVFEGDGTPRTNDFLVNQTTESFQSFGEVAALDSGGFAVTWRSRSVDGSFYAVMLRLYDADGRAQTNEIQVNQFWQGSQTYPDIATLANGNLVLAWQSDGQDGSGEAVVARVFSPDGNPLGNEFQVNTKTEADQFSASVAALSDGGYVIVWRHETGVGTFSLNAQRFAADGTKLGGEVELVNGDTALNTGHTLGETADGALVLSWLDFDNSTFSGTLMTRIVLAPELGSDGNDVLDGTRFGDSLDGLAGNDKIRGRGGNDTLAGGVGDDKLTGQAGNDTLLGEAGQDRLFGGDRNDKLLGGAGHDHLNGGRGRDTLNGQSGNDVLKGGAGRDTFVFTKGKDIITDFDGDNLFIERKALSAPNLTKAEVMAYAKSIADGIEFDFGNGNVLTLNGVENPDDISAFLFLV